MPDLVCPACGNPAQSEADLFCRKCGTRLPPSSFSEEPAPASTPPSPLCPECYGAVSSSDVLCPHCGAALGVDRSLEIEAGKAPRPKIRHSCLMIWGSGMLIFLILTWIEVFPLFRNSLSLLPLPFVIIYTLANLVMIYGIFRWKKWGFWLCCGMCVFGAFGDIVSGNGIAQALFKFVPALILYTALKAGNEYTDQAWPQLE